MAGVTLVSGVGLPVQAQEPTGEFSIVKGETHAQTDYPEVVKIETLVVGGVGGDCGGTILNDRWVLTAGHCFSPSIKATIDITAYTPFGAAADGKTYPVHYQAKTVYIHPRFSNTTKGLPYDVALVELDQPISSGVPRDADGKELPRDPKVELKVPTVEIAKALEPVNRNGMARVVGRGVTGFKISDFNGQRVGTMTGDPAELRSAQVPFKDDCELSAMICANDTVDHTKLEDLPLDERHDPNNHRHPASCVGDSGGPLFIEADGKRRQVGLVSHARAGIPERKFWEGDVCGRVTTQYSSLSYLRPWIDSVLAAPPTQGQAIQDPELPLPPVTGRLAFESPNNPAGQNLVTPYVPSLGDTRPVLATLPKPRGRQVHWAIRPTTSEDGSDLAIGVNRLRKGLEQPTDPRTIALISSETKHADALASGVLQQFADLYLTNPDSLEPQVGQALKEMGYKEVWILGGPQAVSPVVEDALKQQGLAVRRIAGADRTQTAVAIANAAKERRGNTPATTYIARAFGDEHSETRAWADSIAIGGLAARSGNPVLLSATNELSSAARASLTKGAATTVVGGPGAISPKVAGALREVTGKAPVRLAGSNRAETAVQIGRAFTDAKRAIIIDGHGKDAWQLGFSVAGLSQSLNAPILLAGGDVLTPETLNELKRMELEQTICIGADSLCAEVRRVFREKK